jgi:hypothetical protein
MLKQAIYLYSKTKQKEEVESTIEERQGKKGKY